MSATQSEFYPAEALTPFLEQGVVIPAPHQVAVGREVEPQAIAPGAILHPFCRITGSRTRIDAGTEIGAGGPAMLHDCWIGAGALVGRLGPVSLRDITAGAGSVLGAGSAETAVFLGKEVQDPDFSTGYGFRVRKGSLYEEDANSAQHTDTKMTILFPWVTLGSNINWCDVLVAGGTGAGLGDFSEIGSGAIHFNFTPRGDKATASLLGNVVDGVFLRETRLFIGGHASLVGPLQADFGSITGAGGRFHRDLQAGMNLAAPPTDEAAMASFRFEVYGSIHRLYTTQVRLVGQLWALDAWYGQVRERLAGNDAERRELYRQGRRMVQLNIAERIAQLGVLATRMELSAARLREEVQDDPRINQHTALLEQWPRIETHLKNGGARESEPPRILLDALQEAAAQTGGRYTATIQALPEPAVEAGRSWLRGIVEGTASREMLGLVPALRRVF